MPRTELHKKFIFNRKIDHEWLYSLYEYDYPYIMEVFSNSLDALRQEHPALSAAYENDDIPLLRKTIHKIKPLFGFVGLLDYQELAARFENACAGTKNTSNLTIQYIELVGIIDDAKATLLEECRRLNDFIG